MRVAKLSDTGKKLGKRRRQEWNGMARTRRTYRRTTSQQAVSLFTSVLPAPIQQIANSQIGSTLLFFGVPAMVIAGVLQLNWDGGVPHLTIDRGRAAELEYVARNEIGKIGNPGTIEQWEDYAHQLIHPSHDYSQTQYGTQPYSNTGGIQYNPQQSLPNSNWQSGSLPIPSSSAARNGMISSNPTGATPNNSYSNPQSFYPQSPQSPSNYPYPPQPYNQPPQPYYQQPQAYSQPPPQPYAQPSQYQSYQQPAYGQWRQ